MKSFLTKTLMLAATFALTACELDGALTARQNTQLIDKKGRVLQLQAGASYSSSIEKKDGMLEIDIDINGKERKVQVRPPAGQPVPQEEGEMFVTAAQSGQPVDLHGILNTDYVRGPDQWGYRRCQEVRQVQVCGYDQHGKYVCRWENRYFYGDQEVRYYNLTTTRTGEIRLLNPGTNVEAAKFYGRSSGTQQVITYEGFCRIHGPHGRGW